MELKEFYQSVSAAASRLGITDSRNPCDPKDFMNLSEACLHLGESSLKKEDYLKAEQAYLLALRIRDMQFKIEEDQGAAQKAEEICMTLADLNMQQGNMHGADVYYVKALSYRKKQNR